MTTVRFLSLATFWFFTQVLLQNSVTPSYGEWRQLGSGGALARSWDKRKDITPLLLYSMKRGCEGFPCIYTHLSAKAGDRAVRKTIVEMIDECLQNPDCKI